MEVVEWWKPENLGSHICFFRKYVQCSSGGITAARGRARPKTIYRKTVQENADDYILTKQYFPRAHTEERRELKTGLIVVTANNGQLLTKKECGIGFGPGNSSK